MRNLMLLFCGLFSVGCSALNIQTPTAAITGMSVANVDAKGFTMNFNVDLTNPNSVALPLTAADYKLGLSGVNVVQGNAQSQGSIPAGGSKSVVLPVAVTYENLLAVEQSIVKGGGDVPYALDGAVSYDTGMSMMGTPRVPVQYNGTLHLKEILNNPQALMQSSAAQKLAKELLGNFFGH